MRVCGLVVSLNLILQPTKFAPMGDISSETRLAMDTAATRLGCVQTIRALSPWPAAMAIFGSWVVLPQPVSPVTTITWF